MPLTSYIIIIDYIWLTFLTWNLCINPPETVFMGIWCIDNVCPEFPNTGRSSIVKKDSTPLTSLRSSTQVVPRNFCNHVLDILALPHTDERHVPDKAVNDMLKASSNNMHFLGGHKINLDPNKYTVKSISTLSNICPISTVSSFCILTAKFQIHQVVDIKAIQSCICHK